MAPSLIEGVERGMEKLAALADGFREGEADGPFADRKISYAPVELTSRVSTDKVAEAKRMLALPFHDEDHVPRLAAPPAWVQ